MSTSDPPRRRCRAHTRRGGRCRNWALRNPVNEDEEGLCAGHAGRIGNAEDNEARRCTAITASGQRCRHWALLHPANPAEEGLCANHAGRIPPLQANDARRCNAITASGQRCRHWALRDAPPGPPPLCNLHARARKLRPGPLDAAAGRRCTARNRDGTPCRKWATRASRAGNGPPLCHIHAASLAGTSWHVPAPGPADSAAGSCCTARRADGSRCPRWATHASRAGDGLPLCNVHAALAAGTFKGGRTPGPEEAAAGLRCTATTITGARCRRWATAGTEPPLCWFHAYPDKCGTIRHGYYRATPPLSPVEWAAIDLCRAAGRPLDGEIVLTRLLLRLVVGYLRDSDRPLRQDHNAMKIIFDNVHTVARLLVARQQLEETAPEAFGAAGEEPAASSEPAAATLQVQATDLLADARRDDVADEVALVRLLLCRLLAAYGDDEETLPLPELIKGTKLVFRGGQAVAKLLRYDHERQPTVDDIIFAALDELGAEWGLEL